MFQSYSPNMLKTFVNCPKKFYFRYVKNITMPTNDEIFEFGKNIHALASYYLRKENLSKMEASLSEREILIWEYLKRTKYFSYEVVNTEYNLSTKIDKYFFGGRLDALVKDDDRFYILDYKTGAVPKNAKYDFQTMIYLLSVRAYFNTNNVTFVYLDLKNREEVVIELTEDLIKEYESRLIETIKLLEAQDFPSFVKKGESCKCEYNIICY